MTPDLSRVPHLAERQALKLKLDERDVLYKATEVTATTPEEITATEAAQAAFVKAKQDAQNAYNDAVRIAREARDAVVDPIEARAEEAAQPAADKLSAFDDALYTELGGEDMPWLVDDDTDENYIVRCALSGLPIRDDDEIIQDDDKGAFLRCLVFDADAEGETAAA